MFPGVSEGTQQEGWIKNWDFSPFTPLQDDLPEEGSF